MQHLNRQSIRSKLIESCFEPGAVPVQVRSVSQRKKLHITLNKNCETNRHSESSKEEKTGTSNFPVNYQKTASRKSINIPNSQPSNYTPIQMQMPSMQVQSTHPRSYAPPLTFYNKNQVYLNNHSIPLSTTVLPQKYQKFNMVNRTNSVMMTKSLIQNTCPPQVRMLQQQQRCPQTQHILINNKENSKPTTAIYKTRFQSQEKPKTAVFSRYDKSETPVSSNTIDILSFQKQFNIIRNSLDQKMSSSEKESIAYNKTQKSQTDKTQICQPNYYPLQKNSVRSNSKNQYQNSETQCMIQKQTNSIAIQTELKLEDIDNILIKIEMSNQDREKMISKKNNLKINPNNNLNLTILNTKQQQQTFVPQPPLLQNNSDNEKENNELVKSKFSFGQQSRKKFEPSQYENFKRRQYYLESKYKIGNYNRK